MKNRYLVVAIYSKVDNQAEAYLHFVEAMNSDEAIGKFLNIFWMSVSNAKLLSNPRIIDITSTANQWISVNERLPTKDDSSPTGSSNILRRVIVAEIDKKNSHVAYFHTATKEFYQDILCDHKLEKVTKWMSMPAV